MADLSDRFAKVRSVEPPALWSDIEQRAVLAPPQGHGATHRRSFTALLAAALAIAVLIGSLYLVRDLNDQSRTSTAPPPVGASAAIDPDRICDVPPYDPSVSLLVGEHTAAYPNTFLDKPGQPAASLRTYGADQLQTFLATHAAVNAPSDGWRTIQNDLRTVTFAAPNPSFADEWWLVGFEADGSEWHRTDFEIVDRRATPAQRGHDLSLRWTGELQLSAGTWNDPLQLVNTGSEPKPYGPSDLAAVPHIFSSAGAEVAVGAVVPSGQGGSNQLPPGEQMAMPIALTAALTSLEPGAYDVVACVPQLGLASRMGALNVISTGVVQGMSVITYPSNGIGMSALAFGKLVNADGCLAIQDRHRLTYVLLPDGHSVVEREGRAVLIGPTGEESAEMGDNVRLGGGYVAPPSTNPQSSIVVPADCASNKAGYFAAGGATTVP